MTVAQLKLEVKQIENIMKDVYNAFNSGRINEARYTEYTAELTKERNELVQQIISIQNERMEEAKAHETEKEEIVVTVEKFEGAATQKQLNNYMQLCREKDYMPCNTTGWTRSIASNEIQKLIAHRKMSPKQKEMILSLQTEAAEAELIDRTLNEAALSRISADAGGKAIERLINLLQTNSDKLKPSEAQINTIVSFYPCPDVPFEDFNISITKNVTDNEGNVVAKRRITRTELQDAIRSNMSRYDASKFISENNHKVAAWKNTRITNAQIGQIRTLEKRIYNLSSPRQVEAITDIWGDIVDTTPQGSSRDAVWQVNMSDVQINEQDLKLMSKDDADAFIKQLNIELNAKQEMLKSTDEQLVGDTARNEYGSVTGHDEFNEFNNLLFGMQAVAGYPVDEFQDEVARIFFSDLGEGTEEAKRKLRSSVEEFIVIQLEQKAITPIGLVNMTESSRIGRDILKNIARSNDAVFEALVYA